jgi:transaldolase
MSEAAVNERLAGVTAAGTSLGLDRLGLGMIESGEPRRMIDENSLRGVTSNPAILEKATHGPPVARPWSPTRDDASTIHQLAGRPA